MTRQEAKDRFNNLPKEHRVTIIAYEIENEIRWIEREKEASKKSYQATMRRMNSKISTLEESLNRLQD